MSRYRIVTILAAVVALALAGGGIARAQDQAAIDRGQHVFDLLQQEKFDDVAAGFNAQMAAAMNADQLRTVWAQFLGQVGAFTKAIDRQVVRPQAGITAVVLGCEFEKGNVNVIVAFDDDNKIAGLRLAPRP